MTGNRTNAVPIWISVGSTRWPRAFVVPATRTLTTAGTGGTAARGDNGLPFQGDNPVTRVTASAVYHLPLAADGVWATTLAYGATHARETVAGGILEATSAGSLLESSLSAPLARARVPAVDLRGRQGAVRVGAPSAGHEGTGTGIGANVAVSVLSPELATRYSGRTAPTFGMFLA